MATYTTPYDLAKPGVGDATDQDQWGYQLNDNMDIINDALVVANYSATSAKTTTYAVLEADQNTLITGDVSGGGFTITLPNAVTVGNGWKVTIKKIDSSSNILTVAGTIDGATNYTITSQNGGATFASNGTNWYTFSTIAGTTGGAGTLPIDQGGTGATTASGARSNLGLGTISTQAASAIAVTGGTMSGVTITGGSISGVSGFPQVTNGTTGKIVFGSVTVQWGTLTGNDATSVGSATFGTAFSGTPYSVSVTCMSTNKSFETVTTINTTGFSITYDNGGSPAGSTPFTYTVYGPT